LPGAPTNAALKMLSKRGSVIADDQSNILFVNDTPGKLDEIRAFIKAVDIGARQVLIEARVVEANDSFNKELGAKLNFINSKSTKLGGSGVSLVGGSLTPGTSTSTTTNGVTTTTATGAVLNQNSNLGVNLPSYSSSGGTLALSLFSSSLSRILNLEISALESDGVGKVISSPRVITANNVKAKIEDGTEIPYTTCSTSTSGQTCSVSFKPAKLVLEVTPQITPEGTVKMLLLIKKEDADWTNAVSTTTGTNPPIKSSIVETNVVVENGGTVVVGGVFVTNSSSSTEKVPFFGDIPYLGALFRVKSDAATRRELLIFITPRVISDKVRFD